MMIFQVSCEIVFPAERFCTRRVLASDCFQRQPHSLSFVLVLGDDMSLQITSEAEASGTGLAKLRPFALLSLSPATMSMSGARERDGPTNLKSHGRLRVFLETRVAWSFKLFPGCK